MSVFWFIFGVLVLSFGVVALPIARGRAMRARAARRGDVRDQLMPTVFMVVLPFSVAVEIGATRAFYVQYVTAFFCLASPFLAWTGYALGRRIVDSLAEEERRKRVDPRPFE